MARLIHSDGREESRASRGTKWTLAELQAVVGGDIELMPASVGLRMVMNEEGARLQLPVNQVATELVRKALVGKTVWYVPTIYGDVLILDKGDRM